jgi:hypothetical protein
VIPANICAVAVARRLNSPLSAAAEPANAVVSSKARMKLLSEASTITTMGLCIEKSTISSHSLSTIYQITPLPG